MARFFPIKKEDFDNLFPDHQVSPMPSPEPEPEPEPALKIVSWADGTDEEIVAMIEAADKGEIDLKDYWNVGDTRTVNLSQSTKTYGTVIHSAQSVEFVLLDKNNTNYRYVDTPASGETHCRFIVGTKNLLSQKEIMSAASSSSNNYGWYGTQLKYWCDKDYISMIPTTLRPIFKSVMIKTMSGGNQQNVELKESQNTFFIAAEKEIMGQNINSNIIEAQELTQWDYYLTDSNRKKKTNGQYTAYWTRSPRAADDQCYCCILSNGNSSYSSANMQVKNGIAPCGCI